MREDTDSVDRLGLPLLSSPSPALCTPTTLSHLQGPRQSQNQGCSGLVLQQPSCLRLGPLTREGQSKVAPPLNVINQTKKKCLHPGFHSTPTKQCQAMFFFLGPHSHSVRSPALHPPPIQMACGCWEPTPMGNGLFHNLLQTLSLTANPLGTHSPTRGRC